MWNRICRKLVLLGIYLLLIGVWMRWLEDFFDIREVLQWLRKRLTIRVFEQIWELLLVRKEGYLFLFFFFLQMWHQNVLDFIYNSHELGWGKTFLPILELVDESTSSFDSRLEVSKFLKSNVKITFKILHFHFNDLVFMFWMAHKSALVAHKSAMLSAKAPSLAFFMRITTYPQCTWFHLKLLNVLP